MFYQFYFQKKSSVVSFLKIHMGLRARALLPPFNKIKKKGQLLTRGIVCKIENSLARTIIY